jgi:cytochrome c oxidase cbb3-type subunit I/II
VERSVSAATAATGTSVVNYDDDIVRKFFIATAVWGVVGMLVGVIIALQLAWWPANLGLPWTTFGRLRPLHTNAVIFAFAGNICFTGIYYSMQRLLKTRMWSDALSSIHFWGWQLIIVSAAITYPLGITQSREYAELIWPIDVAVTLIWVVFAVNFFGTLAIRKVKHIYVAIWFYMSFVITIAVLHIVNNLAVPATFLRSYPIYSGLTDALVQWWYGHNAVGFFLTTPFLGLMYYFLPKAADRPIYSYRLSIVHFWGLIFLYSAHSEGCVAQAADGSDPQVHGRRRDVLRNEHVRGPDDVYPLGERAGALHELGRRARAFRRAGLERDAHLRGTVLAAAAAVES